jgi:hypothetical protein
MPYRLSALAERDLEEILTRLRPRMEVLVTLLDRRSNRNRLSIPRRRRNGTHVAPALARVVPAAFAALG